MLLKMTPPMRFPKFAKNALFLGILLAVALRKAAIGAVQGTDSWSRILPASVASDVSTVATDPVDPLVIYVGRYNGSVLKSSDGGATWQTTGLLPASGTVGGIATVSGHPGTVYVATQGVFKSEDGGQTWRGLTLQLQDRGGAFVALDPADSSIVYAGSNSGLLKSTDSGATWALMPGPLQGHAVYCMAFGPVVPKTLFAGTDAGVFFSTDGGQTWDRSSNFNLQFSGIGALLVSPTVSGTVLAGTFNTISIGSPGVGVYRSLDSGQTWSSANDGFPMFSAVHGLLANAAAPQFVLGGSAPGGVFASADGGASWAPENEGLPAGASCGPIAQDPSSPATFYAVAGDTNDIGLYRRTFSDIGACQATSTFLCLNSSRFRVHVAWQAPQGHPGSGQALPVTGSTGAFTFFDAANLEVVIKVLDGRAINGKFWVFGGSLSNVAYSVTVTDTQTGASKTYVNPQGTLASFADTSAF